MKENIGVIDSGIGGLTVVKSIQSLIPNENIIYFGDNKNVPYGNRSEDEILSLTMNILSFLKEKDVKIVAIACNTISTLIDSFKDKFEFPIVDIINPTVDYIVDNNIDNVDIIATEFTIGQGSYERLIHKKNSDIKIVSEGSKNLAALIDEGRFEDEKTKDIISTHINNLNFQGNIENLVLACTHYPIVKDLFLSLETEINIIDPGFQQAEFIKDYLSKNQLLNTKENGSLSIYTSGSPNIYTRVIDRLEIRNVRSIETIDI